MKLSRLNKVLSVIGVLCVLLFIAQECVDSPKPIQKPTEQRVLPYAFSGSSTETSIDTTPFVTADTIQRGYDTQRELKACKTYKAGIVNHHTLASDLLATSALQLAKCRPEIKTIILISPDHFYRGATEFSTTKIAYRVGDTRIEVNERLVSELLEIIPSMRIDDGVFGVEHGVAAVAPYYSKTLPSIEIVPIAIKGRLEPADRRAFIAWLRKQITDPEIFVLVSADMSHYLSKERARANDQKTLEALEKGDRYFFADANDDYVDSGMQISMVIEALGKANWETHYQAISSDYTQDRDNTTTYITGFWY